MSRTLVLRGEPGMGKTALISYAASATDLTRLSVAGVEAESNFAFAGLHRLVSPLLHSARNLPQSQRTALEVAFGLATGPRPTSTSSPWPCSPCSPGRQAIMAYSAW